MLVAEFDSADTLLQRALFLAEEYGLPVFPCRAHAERVGDRILQIKSPLTAHGFKDASRNLEQIAAWWTRYPDALIGVATGAISGLFVIDVDPGGAHWYIEHCLALGAGRTHQTQRGHHLLYKACGMGCTADTLAADVDTRGDGGYVIWWPAHGLGAQGGLDELTEVPAWVLAVLAGGARTDGSGHVDQSRDLLARVAAAIRLGKSDGEILQEFLDHPHASAQADPRRAVQRAIGEALKDAATAGARARHAATSSTGESATAPQTVAPMDWQELSGLEPPPRKWVIPEWIPAAHVTLLAGKAGVGKTLLAQHFATALATGQDYLYPLARQRVLMWAGEDDERELWWRQLVMCSYFHLRLTDLIENFRLFSYSGVDMTLASTEYGALIQTPGLELLRSQCVDFKPDIVMLDNIARLYGGNENNRHDVTTFVAWVQSACAPAAVLLLGHPAKAAGSEFSGSTAWEGSVRSRLYLSDKPPDQTEDDEDTPINERARFLSRRKANYSDREMVQFTLQDGSLIPLVSSAKRQRFSPETPFSRGIVESAVLRLGAMNIYGSATPSPSYLPTLAKQYGFLGVLSQREFTATMRAMMVSGTLLRQQVGRYPGRAPKFGLVLKTSAQN